jgi:hypothetical protein
MRLTLNLIETFDPGSGKKTDWEEMKDKHFESQRVVLDNRQFGNCSFVRCTFLYSGGPVGFHECEIDAESQVVCTGAAQNAILLKRALDNRPNPHPCLP